MPLAPDPADSLPRVTAGLLRSADTMCARRLDHEHRGVRGNRRSAHRFRVANQLVDDARLCHVDARAPDASLFRPGVDLEPEQVRVYENAVAWYVALFSGHAVRSVDLEYETVHEEVGVRLVGPVGLAVEDVEGARELRLLRIGGAPLPAEPLETTEVRFALLRVAGWLGHDPARVVLADLARGERVDAVLEPERLRPRLEEWLAARVARIRERTAQPIARSGIECGWCPFVAGCRAHR
jgi:hypothetical protein